MSAASQTGQAVPLEQVLGSGGRRGAAVEVMTPENRLLFVGKIEAAQEGAVCIRDTNDEILPMVLVNRDLKLRFFTDQGSVVLQGKVCGSTMRMWKVDRLRSVFTHEHRAFFRQSISVEIMAQCGKRLAKGGPEACLVKEFRLFRRGEESHLILFHDSALIRMGVIILHIHICLRLSHPAQCKDTHKN